MKLIFKKNEDAHIQVLQKIDTTEKDFSYEDMIKTLIKTKSLETPEISEDFSESEVKSIKSMVQHINNEIGEEAV